MVRFVSKAWLLYNLNCQSVHDNKKGIKWFIYTSKCTNIPLFFDKKYDSFLYQRKLIKCTFDKIGFDFIEELKKTMFKGTKQDYVKNI